MPGVAAPTNGPVRGYVASSDSGASSINRALPLRRRRELGLVPALRAVQRSEDDRLERAQPWVPPRLRIVLSIAECGALGSACRIEEVRMRRHHRGEPGLPTAAALGIGRKGYPFRSGGGVFPGVCLQGRYTAGTGACVRRPPRGRPHHCRCRHPRQRATPRIAGSRGGDRLR
jgi:hypothetical protein